jgi:hypothetical protein
MNCPFIGDSGSFKTCPLHSTKLAGNAGTPGGVLEVGHGHADGHAAEGQRGDLRGLRIDERLERGELISHLQRIDRCAVGRLGGIKGHDE